jgi:hypothetical protein
MYPDGSGSILVELRRHHDIRASCDNKEFLVTKRLTRLPGVLITKSFGTYPEATRYWDEQVMKVADQGLERRDAKIVGFHEEG